MNQDKLSNPFAFIRWLKFKSVWTLIAVVVIDSTLPSVVV
jgi:hypothetical protein